MVEIRAIHLPVLEPLSLRRDTGALAGLSLRPLARGLVVLAALSLPVLGCTFADWFHGSAPGPMQVVAVPFTTPQSGTAAKIEKVALATTFLATTTLATPLKAMLAQPKLPQSLVLR